MTKRTRNIIEFLKEADKLKSVERRVHTATGRPENSAEHSWHLALAVWLLKGELGFRFNVARALELALIHDLVEIYAGDTYFFDDAGHRDKDVRERKALTKIAQRLPKPIGNELSDLWREYEAKRTRESKVVNALDKIVPVIQNIISGGREWKKSKLTLDRITTAKNNVWPKFSTRQNALWEILRDLLTEAKRKKLLR